MVLLDSILAGENIDVGRIIYKEILNCMAKSSGNLFFPCLITDLICNADIEIGKDEERKLPQGAIPTDFKAKQKFAASASFDSALLQQMRLEQQAVWQFLLEKFEWEKQLFNDNFKYKRTVIAPEFPYWVLDANQNVFQTEMPRKNEQKNAPKGRAKPVPGKKQKKVIVKEPSESSEKTESLDDSLREAVRENEQLSEEEIDQTTEEESEDTEQAYTETSPIVKPPTKPKQTSKSTNKSVNQPQSPESQKSPQPKTPSQPPKSPEPTKITTPPPQPKPTDQNIQSPVPPPSPPKSQPEGNETQKDTHLPEKNKTASGAAASDAVASSENTNVTTSPAKRHKRKRTLEEINLEATPQKREPQPATEVQGKDENLEESQQHEAGEMQAEDIQSAGVTASVIDTDVATSAMPEDVPTSAMPEDVPTSVMPENVPTSATTTDVPTSEPQADVPAPRVEPSPEIAVLPGSSAEATLKLVVDTLAAAQAAKHKVKIEVASSQAAVPSEPQEEPRQKRRKLTPRKPSRASSRLRSGASKQ